MPIETHHQLVAAREQLDDAIRMYFEGRYFAAATLAGAAEEIFGAMLEDRGTKHALRHDVSATLALMNGPPYEDPAARKPIVRIANAVRDWLKHFKGAAQSFEFDSKAEAADLIDRAVANYFALTGEETQAMQRFKEHRMRRA